MAAIMENNLNHHIHTSLKQIKERMMAAQDHIQEEKFRQIIEKMKTGQMYITFCGHFSAGKSSLINYLCGHQLLPSSPIPTSANVVSIRDGIEQALVKGRQDQDKTKITLEELKQYCVNGTDIESIEIQYPIPLLNNNMTLLDTPGIDSTDDAHYLSTDSALHLADVVFYVMDYNHVQSEVNFNFAKRLQDMGKPLYLIVNQIDKHRADELSFNDYRAGVKQAFKDWHIDPEGIIYISVKDHQHPLNQLNELESLIHSLSTMTNELRSLNIQNAARNLIKEHVKRLSEDKEPNESESYEEVHTQWKELQSATDKVKEAVIDKEKSVKKEIRTLLDNANIIPAMTRDLADDYLQSCKPGFKVGLFFAGKKTLEEKMNRLMRFQQDFLEQINAHIERHLQDLLRSQAVNEGADCEQNLQSISNLKTEITSEWLEQRIQSAGLFSDEYTMNYAKQISSEVKEMYRKQAFVILDQIMIHVKEDSNVKLKELEEQKKRLSLVIKAQEYEENLYDLVNWEQISIQLPDIRETKEMLIKPVSKQSDTFMSEEVFVDTDKPVLTPFSKEKLRGKLINTAQQLRKASAIIEELQSMDSIVKAMQEKANRLEESRFTIALFGAFSAGKSSFANALLGRRVLPVSPNPTTAAINKIAAPDEYFSHGTAKIIMKNVDKLFDEIQYSLDHIGFKCINMEDALETIHSLQPDLISGKGKPHYAFLRAVELGWSDAKNQLGEQLQVNLEQFKAYAANESKSCFVETIELFYSCPFTEAGFVLVDTPGADSINARHTGVAFDYIKNADLILFVTYYNHAFSQADREFLLQLGRVKDSFELDKMFFIINAADLASTDEELEGVVNHLETNLVQYGIRNPHIYPVSSIEAIEGKERSDPMRMNRSGITAFESEFLKFTTEELMDLAVQSANQEVFRSIQVLEQRIDGAREGEKERKQKAQFIRKSYSEIIINIQQVDYTNATSMLSKEIIELLYYVKQRVLYRFGELFNLAFNPSDLRENPQHMKKAVQGAYDELIRSLSFTCSQEVLATTLRVENYMNSLAKTHYEQINEKISNEISIFQSMPYQASSFKTPNIEESLPELDMDQKKWIQHFKNTKHFFEGEGKNQLKQQLEKDLFVPVGLYLEHHSEMLYKHYQSEWITWIDQLTNKQLKMLEEDVSGYVFALEENLNIEDILDRQSRLKLLLV